MSYINIYDVLPKEMIEQIQEYIDGVQLYIPKKLDNYKPWGTNTDIKEILLVRNQQIKQAYEDGKSITELTQEYFLAEKTIQKIIYNKKDKA